MKRFGFLTITSVILLIASAGSILAQESDVVYVDGWVDMKDSRGDIYELFIGDHLVSGDTVITGEDGTAELEPQQGSRIIITPDTVFSLSERNVDGNKQSVAATTIGQVMFKFNMMTQEPLISTPSAVAGVRGTEFTVYAGADGSSLITVDSGAVEVFGTESSVYLAGNEGVEMSAEGRLGDKFDVFEGKIDFSAWNASKIDSMMAEPVSALRNMNTSLLKMLDEMEEWGKMHEEASAEVNRLREKQKALIKDGKVEEAKTLESEELKPLEISSSKMVINYRHHALSALSMRQHVIGAFYLRMKTAYIRNTDDSIYRDFLNEYQGVVTVFESRTEDYLIDSDY